MKKAVAALAILVASPAVAADQFDLVCSGTHKLIQPYDGINAERPFSEEIRLDLASKSFCENACEVIKPIFQVDPQTIQLEQNYSDDPVHGTQYRNINRVTGHMTSVKSPRDQRSYSSSELECSVEAFKGFPQPATKF